MIIPDPVLAGLTAWTIELVLAYSILRMIRYEEEKVVKRRNRSSK